MTAITGIFSLLTLALGVIAIIGPIGFIAAMIFAPALTITVTKKFLEWFLGCKVCMLLAVLVVASVVSFWVGRNGAYNKGVDDTIAKIARNDAKLVSRAKAARGKLLKCQEQNMKWDQSTGACQ